MSNMYKHDTAAEIFHYTDECERIAYIKGLNAGRVSSQRFTAACAAMQGLFADPMPQRNIVCRAVELADELLAELAKGEGK